MAPTVCCRNRRLDFAGWNPREAWVASRRTVAGSLRRPCRAGGAVRRPVVAAFGQARPRGWRGSMASLRCACRGRPVRVCADVAAPGAAAAPATRRVTGTCRVVTRRSRVRVPRFWRRAPCLWCELGPLGPTLPLRSELAGSGADYGRRWVMRANVCVNAGKERAPAMARQAKRPAIAGARATVAGRSGGCG